MEIDEESYDSIPPPSYEALGDFTTSASASPTVEEDGSTKSTPSLTSTYVEAAPQIMTDNVVAEQEASTSVDPLAMDVTPVTEGNEATEPKLELDKAVPEQQQETQEHVKEDQIMAVDTVQIALEPAVVQNHAKDVELPTVSPHQEQQQQPSGRPVSREFAALQRSLNDSKVLSEYVTDTTTTKPRKLRPSASVKGKPISLTPAAVRSRRQSEQVLSYQHLLAQDECPMPHSADKPRKPRKFLPLKDESNSSTGMSADPKKKDELGHRSRSKSMNRRGSSGDEFDDISSSVSHWTSSGKRANMRSQNTGFRQKHMAFLNRVMQDDEEVQPAALPSADASNEEEVASCSIQPFPYDEDSNLTVLSKNSTLRQSQSSLCTEVDEASFVERLETHLKATWHPPPKRNWDSYCWKCHLSGNLIPCSKCVRSFHAACVKMAAANKLCLNWICPECISMEHTITGVKKGRRNELSADVLSQLLSFALNRMKNVKGHSRFFHGEDILSVLSKYILTNVTFETLQEKVDKKSFRTVDEFLDETKWMVHNAYILSGAAGSKDVLYAKAVLKTCKQEANEIETCAECYLNANTRTDWFIDVCSKPHLLLWAKLKGFPYWPAKAMGLGQGSYVNVRFFGEHDRAFVPVKECFLYSEQDPNLATGKRSARELADCIKEIELHIQKIRAKVGAFRYAPLKMQYDPAEEMMQLEQMMPGVVEYIKRQQALATKPPLQYKIVKTGDNHLSMIKKASAGESGDSDQSNASPAKKRLAEKSDKYEVVPKACSEDKDSNKVSAVILKKRKSASFDAVKSIDLDQPMEKMAKKSDVGEEHQKKHGKRKHSTTTPTKTAELEQHVPMLTIKTNGPTVMACSQSRRSDVATQNVVQSDKTKQESGGAAEKNNVRKQAGEGTSEGQVPSTSKEIQKKSNGKVIDYTNLGVRDLVPFVEIKQEIVSDDEEFDAQKKQQNEKQRQQDVEKQVNANETKKTSSTSAMKATTTTTTTITTTKTSTTTASGLSRVATRATAGSPTQPSTSNQSQSQLPEMPLALTEVKQEILSDDEEQATVATPKITVKAFASTGATPGGNMLSSLQVTTANTMCLNNTVRRVGETTIQRVPTKTSNAQLGSPATTMTNIAGGDKNKSLRGAVPYGPLLPTIGAPLAKSTPNSKTHSNVNSHSSTLGNVNNVATLQQQQQQPEQGLHKQQQQQIQQQQQLPQKQQQPLRQQQQQQQQKQLQLTQHQQQQLQQRARKTFPNRSPVEVTNPPEAAASGSSASSSVGTQMSTIISVSLATNSNTTTISTTSTSSNNLPLIESTKRSQTLKTASMVSIPVDVATARNTSSSIPVPPLTAVSKPVSNPGGQVTAVANNAAPVGSLATAGQSVFGNCNGIGNQPPPPPPPLAGLSQSSTINASGTSAASTGTILTATTASISSTFAVTSTSSPAISVVASNNGLPDNPCANASASAAAAAAPTSNPVQASTSSVENVAALNDESAKNLPKLYPMPKSFVNSDGTTVFNSQAGLISTSLTSVASKVTDYFLTVVHQTLADVVSTEDETDLRAQVALLKLELEQSTFRYEEKISKLRKEQEEYKVDIMRKFAEQRKQMEAERLRAVEETKSKQWCANCKREAQFYCCWNTSYCDYPCQQVHWNRHAPNCAQPKPGNGALNAVAAAALAPVNIGIAPISNITSGAQLETTPQLSQRQQPPTQSSNVTKTSNYNKNSKKNVNKNAASMAAANAVNSTLTAMQAPPAELLKLPSNTYLRALPPGGNNAMRNSTYTMPMPIQQRYQIPLPITAQPNTNPPYTIIQRGSNWELMSAPGNNPSQSTLGTGTNITTVPATISTISPAQQQQQQHHQQQIRQQSGRNAGGRRGVVGGSNPSGLTINSNISLTMPSGGSIRPAPM